MSQLSPFAGSAAVAGVSPDFFFLTTAMNDSALAVGSPVASPLLPKQLRAVRANAAVSNLLVQSRGGGVVSVNLAAGEVLNGYIVAVKGVPDNTTLVGYV